MPKVFEIMGVKGNGNRQRIISAADSLFYRHGYHQTSFQDISEATAIPRGNFYYYFKTKDEILNAVVDARISELNIMLKQCEVGSDDARERLLMFSNILEYNRDDVIQSGCPFGTLSSELAKGDPRLHEKSRQPFVVLRDWIQLQFETLTVDNAENFAMDLLAKLQGVTVMACAFKDDAYVKRSHDEIKEWINKRMEKQ